MSEKKILFIMPDERMVYENLSIEVGSFHLPSLAFAILGAIAKKNGFKPYIIDLAHYDNSENIISKTILELQPDFVGLTCTTALYFHVVEIARFIKKKYPNQIILIGGSHASSEVDSTLNKELFDYLFIGEAEKSFDEFLNGISPNQIEGLAFKNSNGSIHKYTNKNFLRNLDEFPYPDYSLYDLQKYEVARIHANQNPVVWIETSRGCPFDCMICNKIVHGKTFRPKSVNRVVDEIEYLTGLGIKEFLISDDGFTSKIKRAEQICNQLIEKRIKISWACVNGIRVDRVNQQLLYKMREAGCYRIAFGIESGNQSVLNNLGKRVTLEQVKKAVKMARKAKIEVSGYFMFGFLDDNEKTMQDTIDFAKSLPLDLAKASIIMPFPGSPMHQKYSEMGLVFPPGDYRDYNVYSLPKNVYNHPTLDWEVVERFQKRFYRAFYFDPKYIFRRLLNALKNKTLFSNIRAAISVDWF